MIMIMALISGRRATADLDLDLAIEFESDQLFELTCTAF